MFNNNFFYTQLAFAFVSQKDSYCALFFFFFSKILISISGIFSFFIPFFFRKILIFNTCFFLKYFFVFVDNIYFSFLLVFSIYLKNYVSYISILRMTENHSKCLNIKTKDTLYLIFFIRIFFIRIFSIAIRIHFYSVSYLLKHAFFFNNIFTFFWEYLWIMLLPVLKIESIKITDQQIHWEPRLSFLMQIFLYFSKNLLLFIKKDKYSVL